MFREESLTGEVGNGPPAAGEADAPPPMESVDAARPDRNRKSPCTHRPTPNRPQRMARPLHRRAYDRTDACRGREAMQVEAAMSHHEQKGAKSGGTGTAMESGTGSGMASDPKSATTKPT